MYHRYVFTSCWCPLIIGVQVQSSTALFKKITLRKPECIPKLLVGEYVLQLSDLCLCCHQISAYTQVQTANEIFFPLRKGERQTDRQKEFRQTGERHTIEGPVHTLPHPPPLSLGLWYEKTMAFLRHCADKAALKKLIAMINDNGLEESWDTAATYIILSHQSLLLPAPLPPTSKAL